MKTLTKLVGIIMPIRNGHLSLLIALLMIEPVSRLSFARSDFQQPTAEERKALLQESTSRAEQYISMIRPQVFRNLTGRERSIYNEIHFEVTKDDSAWEADGKINADGERVVRIDVGYFRSIEMMTDAVFLEELRNQSFLAKYVRYAASQLSQKATFIKSPYEFVGMSNSDMDKFFSDQTLQQQRAKAVANTIAFVLAHEVGHHVLGHHDNPPKDKLIAERAADTWAIHQLVSMHFPPLAGVVPLLFDFYYEPLGDPSGGTHPTSIDRVRSLFEAMRDAAPKFRKDVEAQGGSYETFKRGLDEKLADLESQMKAAAVLATPRDSEAEIGARADRFCSAVQKVLPQGQTQFSRLAGSPEPNGEAFEAPVLLPGAESCRVWRYRDQSLGSAVVCQYGRSPSRQDADKAFDQLATLLRSCLTGWRSRPFDGVRQRKLNLSGPSPTRLLLRLDESRSRRDFLVSVWFEVD
jgi:hypothetical protein